VQTDGGRPPRSRYWESLAEPHERGFRQRLGVGGGNQNLRSETRRGRGRAEGHSCAPTDESFAVLVVVAFLLTCMVVFGEYRLGLREPTPFEKAAENITPANAGRACRTRTGPKIARFPLGMNKGRLFVALKLSAAHEAQGGRRGHHPTERPRPPHFPRKVRNRTVR
jgi:hypothetical protein